MASTTALASSSIIFEGVIVCVLNRSASCSRFCFRVRLAGLSDESSESVLLATAAAIAFCLAINLATPREFPGNVK